MFSGTPPSPVSGLEGGLSSPTSPLHPHHREAAAPGEGPLLRSRKTWEHILAAPPPSCATWGKLPDLSEPQVPHL